MAGDADGWKRGERGYGKDAASTKWAKTVDFNRERNQGPLTGDGNQGPVAPRQTSSGRERKGFVGIGPKFADKL